MVLFVEFLFKDIHQKNVHTTVSLAFVFFQMKQNTLPESNWEFLAVVVPFLSLRLDELDAELRLFSLPALRAGILLPPGKCMHENQYVQMANYLILKFVNYKSHIQIVNYRETQTCTHGIIHII